LRTSCRDLGHRRPGRADERKRIEEDPVVTRALRSHSLWLTLTYVCLLLLMSRAYI
jgi:hypothetical protein